ncbi:histidine kinase [Ectobacillus funiculus]|uniref:cache domain-containing sensor histidine kinase n=1 Tax=Ectobacillus funiculus TaxID=137993 RepID=UPI00397AACA0
MGGWIKLRGSIFLKFSAAFIIVGLIPLFIISYLSLQALTSQVERQTNNSINQMVVYLSQNIDGIFRKYDEASKIMYLENIASGLFSTNQSIDITEEMILNRNTNDFLRTVLYSDRSIQDAIFVRKADNKVFRQSRDNKSLNETQLPLKEWTEKIMEKPKELAIYPAHKQTYFYKSNKEVITIGRNLIDISNLNSLNSNANVIGTLFITADTKVFTDLLKDVQLSKNDQIYIYDENGDTLFTLNQKAGEDSPISSKDKHTSVIERDIPFINGKVVLVDSKTDLIQQITRIKASVMLVIIICILSLIILSMAVSRMFSKPILLIMKQMKKVESGNLDVRVNIKSKDEVGKLAQGFNQMIERLKSFINEAYIAEIKQKQTELNALKSQIRPHYLYNTLEVVRMKAVYNDDNEVADMIHVLSNQMKYVIDYGEEIVTIDTELSHLDDYFKLIKVRFEDKVDLKIHIGSEVSLDWGIHKLSIQPLVENAIQHGIKPKIGNGLVELTINKMDNDSLVIIVSDDGVGMNEQRVNEINQRLSEGYISTNRSVGMWNVNERIKTLAGNEYGLTISSKINVGTSVRMVIPIVREVQEKNVKSTSGR